MSNDPLDFLSEPYRPPQVPPPLPKPEGFTIVEYLVAFFISFPLSWILFWIVGIPLAAVLPKLPGMIAIGLLTFSTFAFPFVVVLGMKLYGRRRF